MVENVLQKIVWQFLKKKKSLTCNCHTALQPPSWASAPQGTSVDSGPFCNGPKLASAPMSLDGGTVNRLDAPPPRTGTSNKKARTADTHASDVCRGRGVPRRDHGRRERHGGSAPGHRHKASIAVTRALSLLVEALAVHARTVQPLRGLAVRRAQNQAELNTHAQMSKARARKRERDPWKVLTPTPWL